MKKFVMHGFSIENWLPLQQGNSTSKPVSLWFEGSKVTKSQLRSIVKSFSVLSDEILLETHNDDKHTFSCWLMGMLADLIFHILVPNIMSSIY